MPLALEDATKVIRAFLLSGKEYVCLMQTHADVSESRINEVLSEFVGEIYQKPPLRSSVKREIRKRRIYWVRDVEVDGRRVLFRIACQAGTYIRKICSDIGEIIGCGAHMRELRRTRAGPFTDSRDHYQLYDVLDAFHSLQEKSDESAIRRIVRPMEEAFVHIPRAVIRDSAVNALCHGADLAVPGVLSLTKGIKPKTPIGVFTLKGELVTLSTAEMSTDQILSQEKGIAAKTNRVVMPADTYPKMWKSKEDRENDRARAGA